jgi:menaquinone-dependent protoporphyrinogen IX oxidase
MNKQRILVAYTTNAGTTADVAELIAEELGQGGTPVDVKRLEEITSLEPYSAIVIGAPMILGWHKAAMKYIGTHRDALSQVPVAYFVTAMRLTDLHETSLDGIPLSIDPKLASPPKNPQRLGIKERYATVDRYLKPVLTATPGVSPASVAFFGGKLELYRLKWWQALFVLVIIQAQPGGSYNKPFIRQWAAGLRPLFDNTAINQ